MVEVNAAEGVGAQVPRGLSRLAYGDTQPLWQDFACKGPSLLSIASASTIVRFSWGLCVGGLNVQRCCRVYNDAAEYHIRTEQSPEHCPRLQTVHV
jgi:hypothetical protein